MPDLVCRVFTRFFAAARTVTIKVKRVGGHFEIKDLPHHVLNLLHAGIAELQHLATIIANQVIMLLVTITLFVLRQVFPELVLLHQITTHQQLQCVVDRRTGHPVIIGLHVDVQRLRVKMIFTVIDLFEDGVPLGRPSGLTLFKVSAEDVLNRFNIGGGVALHNCYRLQVAGYKLQPVTLILYAGNG